MLISCANSGSYAAPAASKRIPNLPANVYHKKTTIPSKERLDVKETNQLLKQYELNDIHNEKAIDTAIKSHKRLQQIHNK